MARLRAARAARGLAAQAVARLQRAGEARRAARSRLESTAARIVRHGRARALVRSAMQRRYAANRQVALRPPSGPPTGPPSVSAGSGNADMMDVLALAPQHNPGLRHLGPSNDGLPHYAAPVNASLTPAQKIALGLAGAAGAYAGYRAATVKKPPTR